MKIKIIPAIDVIDGKAVRLTQGDYGRMTVYDKSPADVAKRYEDCGITRLHIVDLDGAKADEPQNLRTLEQIANATSLQLQYGGGLKSTEAVRSAYNAGASRAICGSLAVKNPSLMREWLQTFGPERIILGADVREGKVAVKGWLEDSPLTIDELLLRYPKVTQAICTDISRDGMLCGPSTELYLQLQERYPQIAFTVSGGIAGMDDIYTLDAAGLDSVIVGKAIYEGRITLKDLERCLQSV